MSILQIDDHSPYSKLIGVGGLGTGMFFALEGEQTLGRNESRPARLLDVRDYCKLHIVIHYVAILLGAHKSGMPFHVVPVGKVGADQAGSHVLDRMQQSGMDTSLVQVDKEKPTLFSVCFQYPDGSGGNITTNNSAAGELSARDLVEATKFLKSAGRKTIALAVPEVPLAVRYEFLKAASETKSFRAASFVDAEIVAAKELGMFEMLDLVAFNESEAEAFTGRAFSDTASSELVKACCEMTESHPQLKMLVTAGKRGAFAFADGSWDFYPAPSVQVASSAGAGDALLGGALAALAAGLPFLRSGEMRGRPAGSVATALELGVLLGSLKVTSPHTIHPAANLDTLRHFGSAHGIEFSAEVLRRTA